MYSYLQKKKENPNTKQENRFSLSVGASDIAKKFMSFLNSLISLISKEIMTVTLFDI